MADNNKNRLTKSIQNMFKLLVTPNVDKQQIKNIVYDEYEREKELKTQKQKRNIFDTIKNITKTNELSKEQTIDQQRIRRYKDIDIILDKIPEQSRQYRIFNDYCLSPEWGSDDLIVTSYSDSELISKEPDERKFILNDIYQMTNSEHQTDQIKRQTQEQLKYGDHYVRVIPIIKNKQLKKVKLKNYSPYNIINLSIDNDNFGYFYLKHKYNINEYQERQLTMSFLYSLQENNSPKQLSNLKEKVVKHSNKSRLLEQSELDELDDFISESSTNDSKHSSSYYLDDSEIITEIFDNEEFLEELKEIINDIYSENGIPLTNDSINSTNDFVRNIKKGSSFLTENFNPYGQNVYSPENIFLDSPEQFSINNPRFGTRVQGVMSRQNNIYSQFDDSNVTHSTLLDDVFDIGEFDFEEFVELEEDEIIYIPPTSMVHFKITQDSKYSPYGTSIFEGSRSIQSNLILLEYQMVIYRLLKQPERRKFSIDVTGIDSQKIPEYVNSFLSDFKSEMNIDFDGNIDEVLNQKTLLDDYVVLERDGKSMLDISTIQGGDLQTQIQDIEYLHKKLITSLGLPQSYLGFEDGSSGVQTVLTIQDNRVQKTISRLQKDLNRGIQSIFEKIFFYYQVYNKNFTQYSDFDIVLFYKNVKQNHIQFHLQPLKSIQSEIKLDKMGEKVSQVQNLKTLMPDVKVEDLITYFDLISQTEMDQFKKEEITDENNEEQM